MPTKRPTPPPPVSDCPMCGKPREHHLDNCNLCGWKRPISPPPPPVR